MGLWTMLKAYVLIKIGTGENTNWHKIVEEEIMRIPGVTEAHGIFGCFDIIARVTVDTLSELSNKVIDDIRGIQGVVATETFVVAF
jgi:DNA-binding Lrp family transcriptional regulator